MAYPIHAAIRPFLLAALAFHCAPLPGDEPAETPQKAAQRLFRQSAEQTQALPPGYQGPVWQWLAQTDRAHSKDHLQAAVAIMNTIPSRDYNTIEMRVNLCESAVRADLELGWECVLALPAPKPEASWDQRERAGVTLAKRLLDEGRQQDAVELVSRLTETTRFPFQLCGAVLAGLPKDSLVSRSLLGAALHGFRQRTSEDFIDVFLTYRAVMPVEWQREALGSMINAFNTAEGRDGWFAVDRGAERRHFSRSQDARLFQLLDVIRELDPQAAREIEKKHPDFAPALGGPSKEVSTGKLAVSNEVGFDQQAAARDQLLRQSQNLATALLKRVQDLTETEILTRATEIPSPATRVETLLAIAESFPLTNDPGTRPRDAKRLIDASWETIRQVCADEGADELGTLATLIMGERALGLSSARHDQEALTKGLRQVAQCAANLYTADSNPKDPNLGPFSQWPSVDAYRRFGHLVGQYTGLSGEGLLDLVKDDKVHLAATIEYAGALTGSPYQANRIALNKLLKKPE